MEISPELSIKYVSIHILEDRTIKIFERDCSENLPTALDNKLRYTSFHVFH